jgi:tetratricopeptide (TPR) repeat protein
MNRILEYRSNGRSGRDQSGYCPCHQGRSDALTTENLTAGPVAGDGPLVGRDRELAELQESFADACDGRGGVHLVLGEPGVGKTRLASALSDHARAAGATVIWTRGWGRAAPGYWPWVEVVRSLCRGIDGATLRSELGSGADELLRLAPELAERLPAPRRAADSAAGSESSEIARFLLFDALVALLRARSAEAPVVVLIDDLQAVDEGSLLALDFVSRMLRDAAVLLVVTMHERTPRPSPGAQVAVANIGRAGRRLVLSGLTRESVGELIDLASGGTAPPSLADTVHAVTEGNPFFTREILALLLAEGRIDAPPGELPLPDGVRETIRRRLEPLELDALRTLELAAIVGRGFNLPALERASSLNRDAVLAALDAAAELGLVVELPGTIGQYRFGHGLIVETLVAEMPAASRMNAHRAVGEALEQVYRGAIEAHLPELAHHFLSAAPRGDLAKAVDYAERAARRALQNLAYEQAAELFTRALEALEILAPDVPRRAALLLGLGTAESRAGRPSARATFEAAVAAARSIGADDILAQAALGTAPFALTPGFVDDAHVALLGEALGRVGPGDSPLRVRLLGSLATGLYWSDSAARRAKLAHEALDMARRLGDDLTLAFAVSSAQLATLGPDTTEQGLRWLQTLFVLSDRAGESVMTLAARSRHIDALLELDDLGAADIAIETLERLAREARDRRAQAFVPLHRARRAALDGRFDEANRLVAEVAAISGELSASTIPLTAASQRVVLVWLQHGVGEILELVRAYAHGAPAMPCWRAALAASLAASGRAAEARLEYDRLAADGFAALPRDNLWLTAMSLLTETVASLRLSSAAAAVYAELLPFAGRNVILPTAAFLGPVDLWLGILAGVEGRPAKAVEHLDAARRSATRNGARTSLARIDVEEAALLLGAPRGGGRQRAAALLARAGEDCASMGLVALLARIGELGERLDAPVAPADVASAAPTQRAKAADGDAPVTTMRRIGDVWMIDAGRGPLHISDGRGVRLLTLLLERPGQEIHSLELVAAVDRMSMPAGPASSGVQETGGTFGLQRSSGPALDAEAKAAYRARVTALTEAIAEAGRRGDTERAATARAERDIVTRELGRATGIGGRDRESGSHAERARVNVTRAIRAAIRRVGSYDAALGAELETAIRTGAFCVYTPDRRRPRRWRIEDDGPR